MDLILERGHALGEVAGKPREHRAVDLDARVFHPDQHRHERALERLVDGHETLGDESRLQQSRQAQRRVGVLRAIFGRALDGHLGKGDLRAPHARHLVIGEHGVAQMALGELVEAVAVPADIEHVGHEHGVVDGRDVDAQALEHDHVVFDVLTNLEHARMLEKRL